MELIYSLSAFARELLWVASEFESIFSKPNDPLILRRLYFQSSQVTHGKDLWVGRNLRLLNAKNLTLGERCALGDFVKIAAHAPIKIDDDFIGSTGLHLDSGSHEPVTLQPNNSPITIGKRVWCGINVTILAGVTIGDDVVIGAGSLVCRDIPSSSIAVGTPAKVIKSLSREPEHKVWSWVSKK